jgi:hypothetical protein
MSALSAIRATAARFLRLAPSVSCAPPPGRPDGPMQYAKEHHGGVIREDDARAIAITVYIQSAKMGIIKRRPVQRISPDARRVG